MHVLKSLHWTAFESLSKIYVLTLKFYRTYIVE